MKSKVAYGGLVIDADGRVLLREPKNHFGGYVWTFPKGRPDPDETPEEAAVREVEEETGYAARILQAIPGSFEGATTQTRFFLMAAGPQVREPDWETQEIRWATFAEARELIALTTYVQGRERDLAVLAAAEKLLERNEGESLR
ncbi:MAG: NUDIX domain-containing protein [Gemmataceae bacterium]|nr:NUDIX domain-containing protein [Gemmataceae bacterium]